MLQQGLLSKKKGHEKWLEKNAYWAFQFKRKEVGVIELDDSPQAIKKKKVVADEDGEEAVLAVALHESKALTANEGDTGDMALAIHESRVAANLSAGSAAPKATSAMVPISCFDEFGDPFFGKEQDDDALDEIENPFLGDDEDDDVIGDKDSLAEGHS